MGGLPGIFTRVSRDDDVDNVDDGNCDDNDSDDRNEENCVGQLFLVVF